MRLTEKEGHYSAGNINCPVLINKSVDGKVYWKNRESKIHF